jgi:hypothetical protein
MAIYLACITASVICQYLFANIDFVQHHGVSNGMLAGIYPRLSSTLSQVLSSLLNINKIC